MVSARKEQILGTAAELFADRGFHGVSVHDIGNACGISGPALYRHFASKDAMLAEMLVDISERLLAEGRRRAAAALSPPDVLGELIAWHIDFALTHPSLIVVQEREWANLRPSDRDRVRELQLSYIDVWVTALRTLRPELDVRRARASVQAVFGLLNSTPHSARISERNMREVLAEMANNALLGGVVSRPVTT